MRIVQNWQKSYTECIRRKLEFNIGDWAYLKVSLVKGIVSFGKKGNLSPRYIGSYEIVEKFGPIAECLNLPTELQGIHSVFHVSFLKRSFGQKLAAKPIL